MTLHLRDAVDATRAQVRCAQRFPSELRIVTDTRALRPGDTFLALRGERFDGHAFVREARERGAAAVVVEQAAPGLEDVPTLLVPNTKVAYMQLAGAARLQFGGRVIAVTGSTGKTTTRSLLEQLLTARFGSQAILASPGNENNEIGVSKLLLRASPDHRVLLVEMGARHPGEIAQLVDIALPHAGILTNIGEAHLEIFGSREALAETKWALFSRGAQAVLNARDVPSRARAASLDAPPLWFGEGEPELPGVWLSDAQSLQLWEGSQPRTIAVAIPFAGAHNRANLAAAIAGALLVGVPIERIVEGIPHLALPHGRYESIALDGFARIIYDAYNANESGTLAALDAFASEPGDRRIAILASMAELGEEAEAMHARVGARAANVKVDVLLVGGEYARAMESGARAAGLPPERIVPFSSNGEAAAWVRAHSSRRDVVLLKGSRKYRMEEIVQELRG